LDGRGVGARALARPKQGVGLGTLEALDGDMVALDGGFFQIKSDGRAYEIDPRARTPFAVVASFEPNIYRTLAAPTDFDRCCAYLERLVGEGAACCAVRLDGRFERVKTRSVPGQRKPYPALSEAVKHQPTFELRGVPGSLVGLCCPDCAHGLNVPGYHFHFIAEDRSAGGHVLGFRLASGELSVDREAGLRLELPPGVHPPAQDPSAAKWEALDRIERA